MTTDCEGLNELYSNKCIIKQKNCDIKRLIQNDQMTYFIIPRAWDTGKLLHATTNFDILVSAVQVFQARGNMWCNCNVIVLSGEMMILSGHHL